MFRKLLHYLPRFPTPFIYTCGYVDVLLVGIVDNPVNNSCYSPFFMWITLFIIPRLKK
jgi:hypothetical protein